MSRSAAKRQRNKERRVGTGKGSPGRPKRIEPFESQGPISPPFYRVSAPLRGQDIGAR